jgi:hypothetical protein
VSLTFPLVDPDTGKISPDRVPLVPGLYAPVSSAWQPSTAVRAGQLLTHSGTTYVVDADMTTPAVFDTVGLTVVGGGGSVVSTGITDSTATGRAVLTAATQAAARTAIGAPAIDDTTPSGSAVFSSTKTNTAISAAIAALVASSPAALDTLNELAGALGNDANFATTMTNALAAKAPNMTTTAVKSANYTAAANEIVPVDATAAARTITLPTAPADKTRVAVKKLDGTPLAPGNTVTIARGGSDVFNKTGGSTTLVMSWSNQSVVVQYDASRSVWSVISNSSPDLPEARCYESAGTYVRPNYAGPVEFVGADAPAIRTDGVTTGGDNQAVQGLDSWVQK